MSLRAQVKRKRYLKGYATLTMILFFFRDITLFSNKYTINVKPKLRSRSDQVNIKFSLDTLHPTKHTQHNVAIYRPIHSIMHIVHFGNSEMYGNCRKIGWRRIVPEAADFARIFISLNFYSQESLSQSDASIGRIDPNRGLLPNAKNQRGTNKLPVHQTLRNNLIEPEISYFQNRPFRLRFYTWALHFLIGPTGDKFTDFMTQNSRLILQLSAEILTTKE